jgi:hypothetical protein
MVASEGDPRPLVRYVFLRDGSTLRLQTPMSRASKNPHWWPDNSPRAARCLLRRVDLALGAWMASDARRG